MEILYKKCDNFFEKMYEKKENLNDRTKSLVEETLELFESYRERCREVWRDKMIVFQKTKLNDDVIGIICNFSTQIK